MWDADSGGGEERRRAGRVRGGERWAWREREGDRHGRYEMDVRHSPLPFVPPSVGAQVYKIRPPRPPRLPIPAPQTCPRQRRWPPSQTIDRPPPSVAPAPSSPSQTSPAPAPESTPTSPSRASSTTARNPSSASTAHHPPRPPPSPPQRSPYQRRHPPTTMPTAQRPPRPCLESTKRPTRPTDPPFRAQSPSLISTNSR